MSALVLATWDMAPDRDVGALVLPDGCRDLIFCHPAGGRPHWFVSDLSDRPYGVGVPAGTVMRGFRLRPGVAMDEAALLAAVQCRDEAPADTLNHIAEHARLDPRLAEALACLADGVASVAEAAGLLGVTPRSLQRLVLGATGQTPSAWLQLARVRRAARAVSGDERAPLAGLAAEHGYADQAHMTRAFRRWLGTTPQGLRRNAGLARLVAEAGYG